MLTPVEIAALVAATKGTVDIFDKIAGQIKSVLLHSQKEVQGDDERWRIKIGSEGTDIVVKQDNQIIQVVTGDKLAATLKPEQLALVTTYEQKMEQYFKRWKIIYAKKDASQDPLVNAITEEQLADQIAKMKVELLGILKFLEQIGVHLDDHYTHVRHLVEQVN